MLDAEHIKSRFELGEERFHVVARFEFEITEVASVGSTFAFLGVAIVGTPKILLCVDQRVHAIVGFRKSSRNLGCSDSF